MFDLGVKRALERCECDEKEWENSLSEFELMMLRGNPKKTRVELESSPPRGGVGK